MLPPNDLLPKPTRHL